jgi:hypothetical protein
MIELEKPPSQVSDRSLQAFRTSVRGELILRSDMGYDQARKVWNVMIDRHPAIILRCAGESDVIRSAHAEWL